MAADSKKYRRRGSELVWVAPVLSPSPSPPWRCWYFLSSLCWWVSSSFFVSSILTVEVVECLTTTTAAITTKNLTKSTSNAGRVPEEVLTRQTTVAAIEIDNIENQDISSRSIVDNNNNNNNDVDHFSSTVTSPFLLDTHHHQRKDDDVFRILTNAVSEDLVHGLCQDISALVAIGIGSPTTAGIGSERTTRTDIRRHVQQIWLESPNAPPLDVLVGNLTARRSLGNLVRYRVLPELVPPSWLNDSPFGDLSESSTSDLHLRLELSYLSYQPGAFYQKHVDVLQKEYSSLEGSSSHSGRSYRRRISMILFLGSGDDDERPWDVHRDGGALRVYHPDSETEYCDIPPEPGTMVLFRSAVVPHEVLETRRVRKCVVGWFGSNC